MEIIHIIGRVIQHSQISILLTLSIFALASCENTLLHNAIYANDFTEDEKCLGLCATTKDDSARFIDDQNSRILIGFLGGAAAGAIIGGLSSDDTKKGALVGALIGGFAGVGLGYFIAKKEAATSDGGLISSIDEDVLATRSEAFSLLGKGETALVQYEKQLTNINELAAAGVIPSSQSDKLRSRLNQQLETTIGHWRVSRDVASDSFSIYQASLEDIRATRSLRNARRAADQVDGKFEALLENAVLISTSIVSPGSKKGLPCPGAGCPARIAG